MWLRAERQSGGKGRQGRVWLSPPGNLIVSTLVRIRPGAPPAPTLALVAAVALHDVLAPFSKELRIKWPNDLMAGSAKLAGILLERSGDAVVIGFGANLAHYPDGLGRSVTSIRALSNLAPDPPVIAAALADRFANWLTRWRTEGLAPVRPAWLAAAHTVGTRLSTPEGDGTFNGLDDSGALRLRLPGGGERIVHAGDVFLL